MRKPFVLSVLMLIFRSANLQNGRKEERSEGGYVDDGSLISIQQVPRVDQESDRTRGQGMSREVLRERLDSIIMVLSRVSDRLVSIETKQNQQNERIDNINYRITKLDVQDQEQKTHFSEVWSTLRHRLQATEGEMTQINSILDSIKDEIRIANSKAIEISTKVESLRREDEDSERGRKGLKLQGILTAVFGLKSTVDTIHKNVEAIKKNITSIANITKIIKSFEDSAPTKQDLNLGLASLTTVLEDLKSPLVWYSSVMRDPKHKKADSEDCWELFHKKGKTKSGVYRIQPPTSPRPFFVYCEMEIEGGGWMVIQRREDGTEDFNRDWSDYKLGFGNLAGEFWLGNDKIFHITNSQVNELRIEMTDFSQTMATATYSAFAIGPESEGYALRLLSGYRGDAGDSLRYHVGQKWSTYDMDNDAWPNQNCARDHTGAWWYKSCDTSNLNGLYLHGPVPPGDEYKGIYWYDFHGPQYSLWRTTLLLRRGGYTVPKNQTMRPNMKHSPNIPHPLQTPEAEEEEEEEEEEETNRYLDNLHFQQI